MESYLGPGSIVLSNLVAALVLTAARSLGAYSLSSITLLAIGNLACSCLILFPSISRRPIVPRSKFILFGMVLWACCYSLNYGYFVMFPGSISLSELIIAQSMAPTAAVLLSGDWRKVDSKYQKLATSLVALSILLLLAYLKRAPGTGGLSFFKLPMLISTFCFLGTNVAARIVSKGGSPFWGQPRVAALNAAILFTFILITGRFPSSETVGSHFSWGLLIGFGLLVTQWTFLFGLDKTPPFLAALYLSTSVPISLAIEGVLGLKSFVPIEIELSILYCCFIWVSQNMEYRKIRRESEITD